MKNHVNILLCAVLAVCCLSCKKEYGTGGTEVIPDEPVKKVFSECRVDAEACPVFGDASRWSAGDAVALLNGSENLKLVAATSGNSVVFSGNESDVPENETIAVYPYSASFSNLPVTFSIPADQAYTKGKMDVRLFGAMGKVSFSDSGANVQMKEAFGAISIILTREDITHVTVKANAGETICGDAVVSFNDTPSITVVEKGGSTLSLSEKDGGVLAPGTYILAALPATLSGGVTIAYSTSDPDVSGSYTATDALSIDRASVLALGSKEAEADWVSPELPTVTKAVNMGTLYSDFDKYFDPVPLASDPFAGYFAVPLNGGKNESNYVLYTGSVYKYTSKSTIRFKGHLVPCVFAHKHLVKLSFKSNAFTVTSAKLYHEDGTVVKEFSATKNQVAEVTFDEPLQDGVAYYIDCDEVANSFNLAALTLEYEGPDVEEVCAVHTVQPEPQGTSVTLQGSFDSWNYKETSKDYTSGFEYKAAGAETFTNVDATLEGQSFSAGLSGLAAGTYTVHAWARKGTDRKSFGPDRTIVISE